MVALGDHLTVRSSKYAIVLTSKVGQCHFRYNRRVALQVDKLLQIMHRCEGSRPGRPSRCGGGRTSPHHDRFRDLLRPGVEKFALGSRVVVRGIRGKVDEDIVGDLDAA